MGLDTRTDRKIFPGCVTQVEPPYSCINYPTIQELAEFLQEGGVANKGATIAAGRLYTSATVAELESECGI